MWRHPSASSSVSAQFRPKTKQGIPAPKGWNPLTYIQIWPSSPITDIKGFFDLISRNIIIIKK